jgi:hypothetical protein
VAVSCFLVLERQVPVSLDLCQYRADWEMIVFLSLLAASLSDGCRLWMISGYLTSTKQLDVNFVIYSCISHLNV